jgi:hypothetical protein
MCRVNGQGWSVEAGGHGRMEAGTVAQAGTVDAPDAMWRERCATSCVSFLTVCAFDEHGLG